MYYCSCSAPASLPDSDSKPCALLYSWYDPCISSDSKFVPFRYVINWAIFTSVYGWRRSSFPNTCRRHHASASQNDMTCSDVCSPPLDRPHHLSGASSSWSYKPFHGVCIMITMSKTTKLAKFWVNCSILTEVGNKSCIFWHIDQFSIDSDRCWIKGLNEDLQISHTHGRNTMHICTWRKGWRKRLM